MSKASYEKRKRKRAKLHAAARKREKFVEIRISTKQFPAGVHSILHELEKGTYTYMQAALYAVRLLYGRWSSGKGHGISASELAKMCKIGVRHVFRLWSVFLNGPEQFAKRTSDIGKTGKYQLVSHFCADEEVPLDGDSRTLKCAVAGGKKGDPGGGILERFRACEISVEAFVVWLVLHVRVCDWATQLGQASMKVLQKFCRMGYEKLNAAIDELIEEGMLEIVGERKSNEPFTYQLYPKRDQTKEKRARAPEQRSKTLKDIHVEEDGYVYSHNRLYRQRFKDSRWEMRRAGRKPFRPMKERELHTIPQAIRDDFTIRIPELAGEIRAMAAEYAAGDTPYPLHLGKFLPTPTPEPAT